MQEPAHAFPAGDAIEQLLQHGRQSASPIQVNDRDPVIILRKGDGSTVLETFPHKTFAPLPDHVRQSVTFLAAASFIFYVNDYRTPNTRLFASLPKVDVNGKISNGAEFIAYFDYHAAPHAENAGAVPYPAAAQRNAHVAKYPVPLSLEFQTWMAKNGVSMEQEAFAHFIEANALNISRPDAATMMELALNFEATTTSKFQSKIDRSKGGKNLTWVEEVEQGGNKGTGKIIAPEELEIFIPIFEGEKEEFIKARLEYRVREGKLLISYVLLQPHLAVKIAHTRVVESITKGTALPVLIGALA
jgi:hypothetical protein